MLTPKQHGFLSRWALPVMPGWCSLICQTAVSKSYHSANSSYCQQQLGHAMISMWFPCSTSLVSHTTTSHNSCSSPLPHPKELLPPGRQDLADQTQSVLLQAPDAADEFLSDPTHRDVTSKLARGPKIHKTKNHRSWMSLAWKKILSPSNPLKQNDSLQLVKPRPWHQWLAAGHFRAPQEIHLVPWSALQALEVEENEQAKVKQTSVFVATSP